ncbi:hypothetical protein TREVI0001_1831 [Treponema vincentii ATCC 35580]|uniref:Uncharacterized protein n=1 Tax=Treponema vincentii ATCC 35580 TaxID=596324 RepID=C8PP89_9SPIR|nr:hypothetical protein TREVI0001_1831 [Treponema vincentii ATCC 35580]
MSGTVDVCIVTLVGLILQVTGINGNTASLFLRRVIDLIIFQKFITILFCTISSDRCRKSCLTMVNVTDGTNIHVNFCSFELFLCHVNPPNRQ